MLGFGSRHLMMADMEAVPLWYSWWAKGHGLPSCQPGPAETLCEVEVIEVGMPAIAVQASGRESSCVRCDHLGEAVAPAVAIGRLMPLKTGAMLARPVTGVRFNGGRRVCRGGNR